jgi:hypothetical protein
MRGALLGASKMRFAEKYGRLRKCFLLLAQKFHDKILMFFCLTGVELDEN